MGVDVVEGYTGNESEAKTERLPPSHRPHHLICPTEVEITPKGSIPPRIMHLGNALSPNSRASGGLIGGHLAFRAKYSTRHVCCQRGPRQSASFMATRLLLPSSAGDVCSAMEYACLACLVHYALIKWKAGIALNEHRVPQAEIRQVRRGL